MKGWMMGWMPNTEQILDEVRNYDGLSFFRKSKNVLATFIVVISAITLALVNYVEELSSSGVIYQVLLYLFLAVFVYLNHRWAMVVFCVLYLLDKLVFLLSGLGGPVSHIIFGAIAAMATYSAFRVATELKKKTSIT